MPSDEEKAQAASEADFAIIELQSPSMAMEYTDGRPAEPDLWRIYGGRHARSQHRVRLVPRGWHAGPV